MLKFAAEHSANVYSQNGEDGIINECLHRIDPALKLSVEFGGHDGKFCSNTAVLRDAGWNVMMYDIHPGSDLVMKCEITPENVNQVVRPCSVLSIDCDGPDYGIWQAYTGKPDIVVIEINSSVRPTQQTPVNDPQDGTAYLPMVELGISKGYFLLCHTGNLIFIRNEHRALFPEVEGDGITNHELYFNTSHL